MARMLARMEVAPAGQYFEVLQVLEAAWSGVAGLKNSHPRSPAYPEIHRPVKILLLLPF